MNSIRQVLAHKQGKPEEFMGDLFYDTHRGIILQIRASRMWWTAGGWALLWGIGTVATGLTFYPTTSLGELIVAALLLALLTFFLTLLGLRTSTMISPKQLGWSRVEWAATQLAGATEVELRYIIDQASVFQAGVGFVGMLSGALWSVIAGLIAGMVVLAAIQPVSTVWILLLAVISGAGFAPVLMSSERAAAAITLQMAARRLLAEMAGVRRQINALPTPTSTQAPPVKQPAGKAGRPRKAGAQHAKS